LKASGKKVALISTVAAYIGDQEIETGLHVTTPEPAQLQALMARMVKEGMEYLILEFTSHGAYQNRLWGLHPMISGVTNITHEHLDYHLNYQNYLEAKVSFLNKAKIIVLNRDDLSFFRLKRYLPGSFYRILSYGLDDTLPKQITTAIKHRFTEPYNHSNARLAVTIARFLKLDKNAIAQAISQFPGVPGRMQFVPNKRGFEVVVDFAHTPQALSEALTALRQQLNRTSKRGKLIAVFGCASQRDTAKRPMMGKIGVELADLAVFTAEDPRTEDIWCIIREMKEQLESGHDRIVTVIDRAEAIDFAINTLAKKGDIIGIFGKGPEKSMCIGTTEIPWSDVGTVQACLNKSR
jgi:UDP-N-acetylmuramoyl-L-alanyl-D-glutamate--2,6-diaminopimelate ligase